MQFEDWQGLVCDCDNQESIAAKIMNAYIYGMKAVFSGVDNGPIRRAARLYKSVPEQYRDRQLVTFLNAFA